jgi:hypothetical protein
MKEDVVSIQIALLYQAGPYTMPYDKMVEEVETEFPGSEVKTIPIPEDGPPEIPRREISIDGGKKQIRFSRSRADVFFHKTDPTKIDEETKNVFFDTVLGSNITVGRVGYIQKSVFSDMDFPTLKKKLALDETLMPKEEDLLEAMRRINRKTKLGENECNNIAALLCEKKDGNHVLQLERDVNTISKPPLDIKVADTLREVIESLAKEARGPLFGME